jgi:hypothetical protein
MAAQFIQQVLQGHATAIQKMQQISQICTQLEQTVQQRIAYSGSQQGQMQNFNNMSSNPYQRQ